MPIPPTLRAAHKLLLYGGASRKEQPDRETLLNASPAALKNTTFRDAGKDLGAIKGEPKLRFFDSSHDGWLAFGPGAGICAGASIGARSVRAVLVDANGWEYAHTEIDQVDNQLDLDPAQLLGRVTEAIVSALRAGCKDERLLVDGAIPLLGCSVALPAPISREGRPAGHALSHPGWNNGPLDARLKSAIGLGEIPIFVMNDAHAAAIAVARAETRGEEYLRWGHPRLTVVLRLAGNLSGAVIVIEKLRPDRELGFVSGFLNSILLGGINNQAGTIGHVPVSRETVKRLNCARPDGLAPLAANLCSCALSEASPPEHLEAYASVLAVTQRLYPDKPRGKALSSIVGKPTQALHARALADVGALIGKTMEAPVAMLNPANIVLSGPLALPPLEDALREHLLATYELGAQPTIRAVVGEENDYLRARGAALAMLRARVHRRLGELLSRRTVLENLKGLTHPLKPRDL